MLNAARLANTWPRNDTQLPPIGYYKMAPSPISPGRTYRYVDELRAPPLFRFAEGLRCARMLRPFVPMSMCMQQLTTHTLHTYINCGSAHDLLA